LKKNKYIKYLWIYLLSQISYIFLAFYLTEKVNDNFSFMLIPVLAGIVYNCWLSKKADEEQERLERENETLETQDNAGTRL